MRATYERFHQEHFHQHPVPELGPETWSLLELVATSLGTHGLAVTTFHVTWARSRCRRDLALMAKIVPALPPEPALVAMLDQASMLMAARDQVLVAATAGDRPPGPFTAAALWESIHQPPLPVHHRKAFEDAAALAALGETLPITWFTHELGALRRIFKDVAGFVVYAAEDEPFPVRLSQGLADHFLVSQSIVEVGETIHEGGRP